MAPFWRLASKHLFRSLYFYTQPFIYSVKIQSILTSAWSNTFSFFMAVSFLKADHHMAHDCIGRIGEWLPHCLNVPLHQKHNCFPTLYRILIVWILWLREGYAVVICFFCCLLSFPFTVHTVWDIDVCFLNFKGIDIWFSVLFDSRVSRAHFLPSSRLLDLEKIAVLSRVVFSFVTAALKSRWSHSTGVQITQQQALKNKTAGDFRAF